MKEKLTKYQKQILKEMETENCHILVSTSNWFVPEKPKDKCFLIKDYKITRQITNKSFSKLYRIGKIEINRYTAGMPNRTYHLVPSNRKPRYLW